MSRQLCIIGEAMHTDTVSSSEILQFGGIQDILQRTYRLEPIDIMNNIIHDVYARALG